MITYKLGNKAKCIIRSYAAGNIGDEVITYKNQPYTVLDDVEVNITYSSDSKEAEGVRRYGSFESNFVSEVKLSNVLLTNKILNLIFNKSEGLLCSLSKNYSSDENKKIYLTYPTDKIYQVFIYDDEGQLEAAYGELSTSELIVEKPNNNYLIFYSYVGEKCYSLNKQNNLYLTLDLQLIGNEQDKTATSWMHFEKCALKINNSMVFSRSLNSISLTFKILDQDENDYIVL